MYSLVLTAKELVCDYTTLIWTWNFKQWNLNSNHRQSSVKTLWAVRDDAVEGSKISCKFNIGLHTLILIKNRFQLHALLKTVFVIIRFFIVSECQHDYVTIYINLNIYILVVSPFISSLFMIFRKKVIWFSYVDLSKPLIIYVKLIWLTRDHDPLLCLLFLLT